MLPNFDAIIHKGLEIQYLRAGSGSHVILAFHGFSRKPEEFLPIIENHEDECQLIAIHIPGHSGAMPLDSEIIDVVIWCELMELILLPLQPSRLTVIGYSLGGRLALHTCMNWSQTHYRLLLLAPDGINIHPLQRFAFSNKFGLSLFRWVMRRPAGFIQFCDLLAKLRIIPFSMAHFMRRQLSDHNKLATIRVVLPAFRNFISTKNRINDFAMKMGDSFLIILGGKDLIIPQESASFLPPLIKEKSLLIYEDASHDLLSFPFLKRWKPWVFTTISN